MKILNFAEALKYMDERAAYYEEIGEPADWETMIYIVNNDGSVNHLWMKQIAPEFYDTMIAEEQTGGCRVTIPMPLVELQAAYGPEPGRMPIDFICGRLYDGL